MDAGGLSQMSYQNNNFNHTIGVPGSGFASRGKGGNVKRLSFAAAETTVQDNGAPTPRTSRSHLLAGLRTAPKSATTANFPPPSAPPTQMYHRGLDSSMYSDNKENQRMAHGGPKTSVGSTFSQQQRQQKHQQSYTNNRNSQMYSLPEVLAPPEIHVDEHGQEQIDPNYYAQLLATNMFLAEQQQRLQQQLLNVQAAAQQFQGMNLNGMNRMQQQQQQQQQFATPPVTPGYGMYGQQNKQNQQQIQNLQQSMQPVITAVPGAQAGLYSVYNPLTGQQAYYIDQSAANQNNRQQQPQQKQNQFLDQQAEIFMENDIPQQPGTPRFQVSPPPSSISGSTMVPSNRSISPPTTSNSPPADHSPLPPPSATAFRLNRHKKATSLANVSTSMTAADVESAPRSAMPRNYPATPMTGMFGPGGSRAGEHPIRQPHNPPSIEELLAKPTSKFEGSKNFATRTRRSAVQNLVRAGLERRRAPGTGSTGSISPISETGEFQFQSSGEDSDSGRSARSGGLSGKSSLKSLRTSIHGAIGSERPNSRSTMRGSEVDTRPTTASTSASASDCEREERKAQQHPIQAQQQQAMGSFAAAMKARQVDQQKVTNRRAPMMVLTSAEKRKSSMF